MVDSSLENKFQSEPVLRFDDRSKLINQIVGDCNDGYCTIRMMVEKNGKVPVSCCAEGERCCGENCSGANCKGRNWCGNREIIYQSPMTPRTLVQMKLMEKRKYLDDIHERLDEGWDVAEGRWCDLANGDTAIFRYVWDDLGVRDLDSLCRLVVDSVVDNPPVLNTLAVYSAEYKLPEKVHGTAA